MSLTDYLTNIANAIRTKKGTTDKINAQDFATEIENLPSGDIDEEDLKASYEQGYEAGSADALKDVTTLKSYLDITKSAMNFFQNYTGVSVEGLIKYGDTSNVTNMSNMFYNCANLTTIPALDTSKVTNMMQMFYNCAKLTTIPALDTSKVTNTSGMFFRCSSLTSIPELDTSKVTNMINMFYQCSSLTSIPALDTSNVTSMTGTFAYCSNLTSIPELNTSNVTEMRQMFQNCKNLTTIPALDTSKVTNMSGMFQNCKNLTTIPALDTSNVTVSNYFSDVFSGCSNLKSILMYGMKVNFNISYSTQFEASDLVNILNNLATVNSTQRLTMGATNLEKLTDEQKAIATNKGWTLA